MPSHTSLVASNDNPDWMSIDVSGESRARPDRARSARYTAEHSATVALAHLDIALNVEVEADNAGLRVSVRSLSDAIEAEAEETGDDKVTRRLVDALAVEMSGNNSHSEVCTDALRLAIVTRELSRRLFARQSEAREYRSAVRNVRSLQGWRLKRVARYVDEHLTSKITLQDLALAAGLSRMYFAAQFRAATGLRPHEYLLKRRIERAVELLKRAEISLVDVALTVGFQTQAHFTTVFKRFAGDTPYQWRSAYLGQSDQLRSPVNCPE